MKNKYMANQLDGDEIPVCDQIKALCLGLDNFISSNIADSREKSLALTKLEECAMWATKAVALHGTNK